MLVMGDLPEDAEIACNVQKPDTVLSIGFLNAKVCGVFGHVCVKSAITQQNMVRNISYNYQ